MNHTICIPYFQAVGLYTTQKAIPLIHTHHDLHQLVIQAELNHFKKSILKHVQVISKVPNIWLLLSCMEIASSVNISCLVPTVLKDVY